MLRDGYLASYHEIRPLVDRSLYILYINIIRIGCNKPSDFCFYDFDIDILINKEMHKGDTIDGTAHKPIQ